MPIVTERVVCAECNEGYDSDEHPFCPRCGAMGTTDAPAAAVQLAGRSDPRRRRVQASGIMMAATGGMIALFGVILLVAASGLASTMFNEGVQQPSAPIQVIVTDGGVPVEGVNVTIASVKGSPISALTDANGTAAFPMQVDAVMDVTAGNWSGRLAAITLGAEQDYVLELDNDGPTAPLMDRSMVRNSILLIGGLAAFMGIGPIVGGINAIRLKGHTMAFAGAIIGMIPWLIVLMLSPLLGLLVLACYVAATVFIRQGRTLFTG